MTPFKTYTEFSLVKRKLILVRLGSKDCLKYLKTNLFLQFPLSAECPDITLQHLKYADISLHIPRQLPELDLFDNRIKICRGGQIVTVRLSPPPTTGKSIGQIALPSLPSQLRAVYTIHSDFEISRIVKLFLKGATQNMTNLNSSRFQTLQNLWKCLSFCHF